MLRVIASYDANYLKALVLTEKRYCNLVFCKYGWRIYGWYNHNGQGTARTERRRSSVRCYDLQLRNNIVINVALERVCIMQLQYYIYVSAQYASKVKHLRLVTLKGFRSLSKIFAT